MSENLGDVLDTVAKNVEAEAPAIFCDGAMLTWGEFDRASNALARWLLESGVDVGAKVGLYMRNGPDYVIAFVACLKARLCSFNVNYRYGPGEVGYLLDNADCAALIYDSEFEPVVAQVHKPATFRLQASARGDAAGAVPLERIYRGDGRPLDLDRDPEDLFLLYTGGTTGMPKGVMWPGSAIWASTAPGLGAPGRPPPLTRELLAQQIRSGEGRVRFFVAPPLMHGTGLLIALAVLFRGGSLVLSGAASFEPEAVVRAMQDLRCDGLAIVGDAFARPILDVLRNAPDAYDLRHVRAVISSGMMWSPAVKLGLLDFMPDAQLVDGLGASESSGFASSVTNRSVPPTEARFQSLGAVVLRPDDLTPVRPGSGEVGIVAKAGALPLGYYKDPERTAATYVTIDGVRHVLGGDHATVDADGSIRLLGRGSNCINTAGEKVYPEEVEEAMKSHPAVRDALVFGVAHPRFGESIAAVGSLRASLSEVELVAHVRARLAAYKAPRSIVFVEEVPRAPNGKADYRRAKALFEAAEVRR